MRRVRDRTRLKNTDYHQCLETRQFDMRDWYRKCCSRRVIDSRRKKASTTAPRQRPKPRTRSNDARRIQSVVRSIFGLTSLRPGQQEVIESVLGGSHTVAIMPTGAGKSLCYQVPALLMPGMTVVISPLIALMRDQFEKMTGLGLEAAQVNSALPVDEVRLSKAKIGRRSVEFLFTTPEQFASPDLRALLATSGVDLVVIDEVHCLSQWGHDFRPAYLEACEGIRALGTPTVLALTATASPEVVEDITRSLQLGPFRTINTGLHRPNLAYQVQPVANAAEKERRLLELVRGLDGACIVYAATVRHVEELKRTLQQEGVPAVAYHGRMRARERTEAQSQFMSGEVPLIVATNAFGMGIDRPDIRTVIHYDLPPSLDVYYQESGRAGRDGDPADCILLFQRADRSLQSFFMAGRYPTHNDFAALLQGIAATGGDALHFDQVRDAVPQITTSKVRAMLAVLKQEKLVIERRRRRYQIHPRLLTTSTEALSQSYEERRRRDQTKLEQMVIYAQTALCRTTLLLEALGGETAAVTCGTCDNCRGTAVRAAAAATGAA
jgi:ATP-dependent DNA helicase RecQ